MNSVNCMKTRTSILGITIAAVAAVARVILGTYDTLLPLLQAEVDPMIKGTFHACWHFISIFLVFSVWRFFKGTAYAYHIAILWIGFSICFLVVGITTAGASGLLMLPQWIFLGSAGIFTLIGSRNQRHN